MRYVCVNMLILIAMIRVFYISKNSAIRIQDVMMYCKLQTIDSNCLIIDMSYDDQSISCSSLVTQ